MPHTLPLYDPSATPSTWCERISPAEFAVHTSGSSSCAIFPSLPKAEAFALLTRLNNFQKSQHR